MRLTVISHLILVLFFAGCASFGERHLRIRNDFEQGKLEEARTEIDKSLKKKRRGEADLLKLNRSIIELCSGHPKEAETLLREVRDNFDKYEQKSVAEGTLSMLTDDNAVSYAGEDYEKVLIRVFLALSNLMYDGTDAPAYALQIGQKQNDIIRRGAVKDPEHNDRTLNPKAEAYRQVAAGAYLYGIMREETRRDYDDAVKAYQRVYEWEPDFAQGRRDLQRAQTGVPCQPGNGVVYVFGLVGAGPYKLQQNCEVAQVAQLYASIFLNMMQHSRTVPLGIAPVLIPCVVRPREPVPSLNVSIDSNLAGQTETIMDIGKTAEEQFEAVKPQIIARAMIRRALKKGIAVGAQEVMDTNQWVGLAVAAAGMVWEAMETADTRCWNLLPAEIQVARIEVPAGEHKIRLQPASRVFSLSRRMYFPSAGSLPFGLEAERVIRVEPGHNTYVLANFPNGQLVGQIVVSGR
ncbi:MAG: hypothetical protein LBN39_09200 [Planctomycetaceae bacterium]|jgi:tetratricopeptide (TPR) repeat protein|nr:hypothetical protein [Planctomycetaceae bacterium]